MLRQDQASTTGGLFIYSVPVIFVTILSTYKLTHLLPTYYLLVIINLRYDFFSEKDKIVVNSPTWSNWFCCSYTIYKEVCPAVVKNTQVNHDQIPVDEIRRILYL